MSYSRRSLKPWVRIIGLLALALLQACSAVKLAYNNLPDLGYWWFDGYADLNEPQTLLLRADLDQLHKWHRANELGKIADLLGKVRQLAPAETTPEQVCSLFADLRNRYDAVTARAELPAAALAVTMSPEQIKHIEAKFGKGNIEWRDDWVSGERSERREKRLKAAVERAEQFYGTLDERQRAVLRSSIDSSGFDPQRSYTERLRRQQDLLQTVRTVSGADGGERATVAAAGAALRAYVERSARSPNLAYRAYFESAILHNCRTYAQLHNSTTAQQRARAMGRLAAYERDARELAASP